ARGSGVPDRAVTICPSAPAWVAGDSGKAREGAAWFVAFYLTTMGSPYRQSLARRGFASEVEAVLAANTPRMLGVVRAEADKLSPRVCRLRADLGSRGAAQRGHTGDGVDDEGAPAVPDRQLVTR